MIPNLNHFSSIRIIMTKNLHRSGLSCTEILFSATGKYKQRENFQPSRHQIEYNHRWHRLTQWFSCDSAFSPLSSIKLASSCVSLEQVVPLLLLLSQRITRCPVSVCPLTEQLSISPLSFRQLPSLRCCSSKLNLIIFLL